MMIIRWFLDIFVAIFYFIICLPMVLYKFLLMPGAPPDKKLHCWFGCGITTLGFILISLLSTWSFAAWLYACGIAITLMILKELVVDYWIRGGIAEKEDVLAGLRGLFQSSIWIWVYLLVKYNLFK